MSGCCVPLDGLNGRCVNPQVSSRRRRRDLSALADQLLTTAGTARIPNQESLRISATAVADLENLAESVLAILSEVSVGNQGPW